LFTIIITRGAPLTRRQFGKTGDDEFTMDYTYPFNAVQVSQPSTRSCQCESTLGALAHALDDNYFI
jgi:hypothetical protein